MLSDEKMNEMANTLAARLSARLGNPLPNGQSAGRPRLILPARARDPDALDELTRARHERRIRFIVGRYGIPWIIDQMGIPGELEHWPDAPLLELLRQCEKALKAVMEGVSFDDAGLVRWAD